MLHKILRILFIIVLGWFLGTILIMGSYLLPAERIERNISKSSYIFENEDTYEIALFGYDNTKLDNCTDFLMLQNASYTGKESIINKSMNVSKYSNDPDPRKSLLLQLNNEKREVVPYDRYWHGYLIFLKPMLFIFSYNDLRFINMALQLLLIVFIVYLLVKKDKEKYILPYVISVIMTSPYTVSKSLQFSTIFYLFNISMIVMLLFNNKLKDKYLYYFLIVGMMTSYFDFLTYPLVTLGMPLVLYLLLNYSNKLYENIKSIVLNSLLWGIGYIGMWTGKFLIGSILLKKNLFNEGLQAVEMRTSLEVAKEKVTILSVFTRNINCLLVRPYILIIIILFAYIIYKIVKTKFKFNKEVLLSFIPFFIISLMPFAWYIVVSNHSYIHNWFTYRVLIITVFSILSFIIFIFDKNKRIKKRKRK